MSERWNISKIISLLVTHWQIFLLSSVICFCGALLYLWYVEPTYEVSVRLLIKDRDNSQQRSHRQAIANMTEQGGVNTSEGIVNEVSILCSR